MSDQNTYTPHYSLADIEQYLQGKMTAAEMYALEKAALQDPFLADAIEGYSAASIPEAHQHLLEIQELLLPGKKEAKIVTLPAAANKSWHVAVIAILLLGAGILAWLLLPNGNNKQEVVKTIVTDSSAIVQQHSAIVSGNEARALSSREVKKDSALPYLSNATVTGKRPVKKQEPVTVQKDSPVLYANIDALKKEPATKEENSSRDLASITLRRRQLEEISISAVPTSASQLGRRANNSPQQLSQFFKAPVLKDKMVAADTTTLTMNISGNRLQGRITNQKGEAIAGASVNINHSNHNIITDANGNFAFTSPDTTANITVNSLGYMPQQNLVNTNASNHIVLQENSNALNDITVVGYGVAKKRTAMGALPADNKMAFMKMDTLMPEGGWDKFKEYVANTIMGVDRGDNNLDDIAGIELHGDLEFEFRVDEKGNVKDVTILKSPDENKNGVIVEAVKQGPRWAIPDKKKKRKNKATIRF